MLQALKEKITGWLGWVVIGLIVITFSLFGLGSYLKDKARVYAAKVNGVEITQRELQLAYQQQRTQLEQMLGDAFDPAVIDEELLRERALETLIQRQLLLQEAQRQGLVISDHYLAAFIQAIPELKKDGAFSKERYKRLLIQGGLTAAGFEQDTRQRLLISQLAEGLRRSTFVTASELDAAYRLQAQKRDFEYLTVSTQPFVAAAEISDDEVKAYYEAHKDEFVLPEKVKIAYLRLRVEDLAKDVSIDEEMLKAEYEEKKTALAKEEQRRASHILVQVAADADQATREAARKKAAELLQRARAGEDFAKLAKEYSDDPASAAKGGDLGFFGKGVMVPAFEEAVYGLEKGQLSDLVESPFGYHIIKLTDIRGSEIPTFEEARAEIEKELKLRQAEDLFYDQLERLTDLAYENPDSLRAAADALGLEIRQSDWLSAQGGPGVGQYRKLMEMVFSDDVLEAGNNSEPVEIGSNDVIVARVLEREPARTQALDEVRDQVVTRLRVEQARDRAKERGEALLKQVREGRALQELEEKGFHAYRKAEQVTRSAPGHDPELVREAFRMRTPAKGESAVKGIVLANGDYAIIRLTTVTEADPADMSEAERTQLGQALIRMRQNLLYSVLINDLRRQASIEIPEESE